MSISLKKSPLGGGLPYMHQTADYILRVGTSQFEGPAHGAACYRLVHKESGVCEAESLSLYMGLSVMLQSQDALDRAEEMLKKREAGIDTPDMQAFFNSDNNPGGTFH